MGGLDQPLDQLPPVEDGPVICAECLDPEAQGAAGVAVEDVGAVLLIHGDQLALARLQVGDELPEAPAPAVVVAVEGEGVRGGLAELPEALLAVDVVAVGGHQQPAGPQLDPVPGAQCERRPVWGAEMGWGGGESSLLGAPAMPNVEGSPEHPPA